MKEIKGKSAVVTGAGGGIGRSIALELAKEGANVLVVDIEEDVAVAVAEEARAYGVDAFGMKVDVSNFDEVKAMADAAYDRFGSVEILVNNAGVTLRPFRAHWDATYEDYQWMMNINFWGVLHGHLAFVPRMLKTPGEKHIVNTSSMASLMDIAGHACYSASKAAVDGLSNAAREELKLFDIGLTILHPGTIRTRIGTSARLMDEEHKAQQDQAKSWLEYTENVSAGVKAASNVTGNEVDPDVPSSFSDYITPKYTGMIVVDAIKNNRPHLMTHPIMPGAKARIEDILNAEPTYPEQ